MSEKSRTRVVSGCITAGSGFIGFIIGLCLGIALFDQVLSKLYSVVGEFSFWPALLFPPMAGICLGGLFAIIGGVIMVLFGHRLMTDVTSNQ